MRKSEVHASESVACLNRALNHLKDIWEEIGIPEDQRLQRVEAVHMHVKNLLDMMITEEEGLRKRVLASIETCQKDLDVLCRELKLEAFQPEDGSTMLQLEKDMRTRLKDMIQEKTQRMKDLTDLREQDKDLCDILCSSLHVIDLDSVPSAQDLDAYRAHLAGLRDERNRRHAEFVGIKKQIICCMEELEQEPDGSFERDVVQEDEDAFCLSTDNIAALQLLLSQLESRRAENEALCTSYRTRIQELWDRLQTPAEEREGLQEHMTASRKRNREALSTEVQRLEELKMQNIENFIHSIREEIVQYWNMCFYSHQQRQAFSPYFSEDFSEELLGQHEAELENLKKHHVDHKELYTGVEQWEQNWTLYQALEKKATDPARFNNRGGNLLKEEKQRADLQKSLPKLEKKLKGQIDQWEQEQGRDFQVNGQKFMEYVEEQWEVYREEQEREKLERQMKKSKQTEQDMLYGTIVRTPSKRRLAATPTPGKTRRMNNTTSTMSTPNSTLRSANGVPLCHSPVLRPPLSANKVGLGVRTPGRGRTPLALERNKENMSLRNMAPSPQKNYSINSVASTYSEFARELSSASKSNHQKGSMNSTITHS